MQEIRPSQFLTQLRASLSRTDLPEQDLLDAAVRAAVPVVADWATVQLPDRAGNLRQRAILHVNPVKTNLAWELDRRWPPKRDAPAGTARVLRTGRSEGGTVPDELLATVAVDGEHLQVLRALGLRSYIAAPIHADGAVLGVMSFVTAESQRTYREEDYTWAEEAAALVGAALKELWREAAALMEQLAPGARPD